MNMSEFWRAFKQRRLAYICLRLWLIIMGVSLLSPFIANDKPLIVYHHAKIYTPIWYDYPETTFGGVWETTADYHDPMVISLINQGGFMVMPLIPYAPNGIDWQAKEHPSPPDDRHYLGTDVMGRDVLAVMLYGLRDSLVFALLLTLTGGMLGVVIGALMGYFGGLVDLLGQRFIEIWLGLPQLFILMLLGSMVKLSWMVLFGIMLLFSWLSTTSVTRLHFLQSRHLNFVLTAKNLGVPTHTIIRRHILPSSLLISLTHLPFMMMANIGVLAILDFFSIGGGVGGAGLGELASLGELLTQAKNHLDSPHLAMASVGMLSLLLSLLLFIGEGLREVLDVRMQRHHKDLNKEMSVFHQSFANGSKESPR